MVPGGIWVPWVGTGCCVTGEPPFLPPCFIFPLLLERAMLDGKGCLRCTEGHDLVGGRWMVGLDDPGGPFQPC